MKTSRFAVVAALAGALLATSTLSACGKSDDAGGQTKELRYQGWVGQVTPAEAAELREEGIVTYGVPPGTLPNQGKGH